MFTSRLMSVLRGGASFEDIYSMSFDGTDEYLIGGQINEITTGDFSIGFWFKPAIGLANNSHIVSKMEVGTSTSPGYRIYYNASTNNIILGILGVDDDQSEGTTGSGDRNGPIVEGKWQHVVVSVDRDGYTNWYYDGSLNRRYSTTAVGNLTNSASYGIAAWVKIPSQNPQNYFEGNIAEVFHYSKALNENEVKDMYNDIMPYNHREGIAKDNLTSWYRMGDGTYDSLDYASPGATMNKRANTLITDEATKPTLNEMTIANNTFDSDLSDWTQTGSNWSQFNGTLLSFGGTGSITTDAAIFDDLDKTYIVEWDSDVTLGEGLQVSSGRHTVSELGSSGGVKVFAALAPEDGDGKITLTPQGTAAKSIDDIKAFKVSNNSIASRGTDTQNDISLDSPFTS